MPLILPVQVICNTSDDQIYDNIRINSRRSGKWIKAEDAHDGSAVLCGSGPSLGDFLTEIKARQENGGKVFAMNGAAAFLYKHGICPDYQVIIDARKETADLVGPAKEHLFGSQVHPLCFERMPTARVWHLQVEHIDDYLPEYAESFVEIGGAASVGNTATCLAYALGYRDLQIYGYDSSHRDGKSHAFKQSINDGDPSAYVTFRGKEYLTSLTMKLQAEKFQGTARDLIDGGCRIEVHGTGLLPDMFNAPALTEKEKYTEMWSNPAYRDVAPGESCVGVFIDVVRPKIGATLIDFGCGTGRASALLDSYGMNVTGIDFAPNCLDIQYTPDKFIEADLSDSIPIASEYGYCTDVMEHIPPDKVDKTLQNIMRASGRVFFQISLVPDNCGSLIGQQLHLSVHPYEWWLDKFKELGFSVTWSENQDHQALYYVTSTT